MCSGNDTVHLLLDTLHHILDVDITARIPGLVGGFGPVTFGESPDLPDPRVGPELVRPVSHAPRERISELVEQSVQLLRRVQIELYFPNKPGN